MAHENESLKLVVIGIGLMMAAWLCWIGREFWPSLVASRMVASGSVRVPDKRFVPRVEAARALQSQN